MISDAFGNPVVIDLVIFTALSIMIYELRSGLRVAVAHVPIVGGSARKARRWRGSHDVMRMPIVSNMSSDPSPPASVASPTQSHANLDSRQYLHLTLAAGFLVLLLVLAASMAGHRRERARAG